VLLSVGPGSLLRPGIWLRIPLAHQPGLWFSLASQDLVVPSLRWSLAVETIPFVLVCTKLSCFRVDFDPRCCLELPDKKTQGFLV
jgi:hypothetical protein